MSIMTFDSPNGYVLLILDIPGVENPAHNVYPNCRAKWTGDTLNIYTANSGGTAPRASYHRSIVLVCEIHGPIPPWSSDSMNPGIHSSDTQPSQNGMPAISSGPAGNTPDTSSNSSPRTSSMAMRPVPRPNLGTGSGTGSSSTENNGGDLSADEVDDLINRNIAKLAPRENGSDCVDFPQRGKSATAKSTSGDLVPSGWRAAMQIAKNTEDEPRVISRENIRQSGSALVQKAGRLTHPHRRRYMDKTRTFFEKCAARITHTGQVVWLVSVTLLFHGWETENRPV